MEDSSYLKWIEVNEPTEQLNTLGDMMRRNNRTGFQFSLDTKPRCLKIGFKNPITNIARVEILTPRSNTKQIRLSYFDEKNQTIKDGNLQSWPIHHISDFGRDDNRLDKLCPNFPIHGIRIDIMQTDDASKPPSNVTVKAYIRSCPGIDL